MVGRSDHKMEQCNKIYLDDAQTDSGFPCGSDSKESACNAGDLGLIPRECNLLQYSRLENSMDRSLVGYRTERLTCLLSDSFNEGKG